MKAKKRKRLQNNIKKQTTVFHPPGTIEYTGRFSQVPTTISQIQYTSDSFEEKLNIQPDGIQFEAKKQNTWIQIEGYNNTDTLLSISKKCGLTMLQLEDMVTVSQRPKIEVVENGILIILKIVDANAENASQFIHCSLLLTQNYVVSFQEVSSPIFEHLKERIKNKLGKIRQKGIDYLFYALLDIVIDNYYSIIEEYSAHLEEIEDHLLALKQSDYMLEEIHYLKRELQNFSKIVRPLKDVVSKLEKFSTDYFEKTTTVYLEDVTDHIVQINEITENNREMVRSLMDLYMSSVSNKMNEIMKVLTIMSSIFIPLTFIAGIYGMNFDFMPELHLKYGYFYSLGAMAIITLVLILYFKRRKWL